MADKKIEPKITLEREYIVPLRREFLKVPRHRRVNKAVKALKQFIARHMKIYDRDLNKVKVDTILNDELRYRGSRKPPTKIKVKAIKYDTGIVRVLLVDIPPVIQYKIDRNERKKKALDTKTEAKEEKKTEEAGKIEEASKAEEKEQTSEEKKDTEEKKESTVEAGLKEAKIEHQQMKHISKDKNVQIQRKALKK